MVNIREFKETFLNLITFLIIFLSLHYTPRGEKIIPAVTSGNERTRISVAFTAAASGRKFKPLILIPRKKPFQIFFPPENVIVVYSTSGNFNDNVIV